MQNTNESRKKTCDGMQSEQEHNAQKNTLRAGTQHTKEQNERGGTLHRKEQNEIAGTKHTREHNEL
jgi:hypothetical protein